MEQKQLEGNMKGFRAFTAVGLAFFAFFVALLVTMHCVGMLNLFEGDYPKLLVVLCIFLLYFLYNFLYVMKYRYVITETEIKVFSLFGNKVLPIEQGLTYSKKPLNRSWCLITVCSKNEKISIRTKTEKEVLDFLAQYGTEE